MRIEPQADASSSQRFPLLSNCGVCVLLCLLLTPLLTINAFAAIATDKSVSKDQTDDVRVLIDISGSMKRTDPQNLRAPALRLFASLLPDGSQAGVWTFGQWVNMLIPHNEVNTLWKNNARAKSSEIRSVGLRTNIEDAIKRATWDWKLPDPSVKRSLIILTDGLVDIDSEPEQNSASRSRILEEQLPRLQNAEAVIHTIALSSESDSNLLKQLSSATEGWFETVEDSNSLERLFLRMFEKVSSPDTLPLKNNTVTVDGSIKEVTFLIFKKNASDAVTITMPSGKRISHSPSTSGVLWHQENQYDLVTISEPETGPWHINADLDPDNRVMVVTDLKMKNTQIANSLAANEAIEFSVHLEEAGKIINRKDFLRFIRVTLNQSLAGDNKWKIKLNDNGKAADKTADDGIYTIKLDETLLPGAHELEVTVNGTTFKRSSRQRFKVYSQPVDAQLQKQKDGKIILSIVPYSSLINSDAMRVSLVHKFPDGEELELRIPRASPAEWRLPIEVKNNPGEHHFLLHVIGSRPDGSPIDTRLAPIKFDTNSMSSEIVQSEKEEPKNEPLQAEEVMPHQSDNITINWLMVGLRVLVFNILIAVLIFGLYKIMPIVLKRLVPHPVEDLANG